MNELQSETIQCPYCGELIDIVIDCSLLEQSYIEDCQVCCQPINFMVSLDQTGVLNISAAHENE